MRLPLLCLLLVGLLVSARAAEPFLRKGDVIALVGGEDMVVASEYGYLELLLTRALPDYHLRFRNLAWEGDTVFEQRRDLNFPSYEEQLDKIGATVVIAQFGQMESLAGKEKLPEFIAAFEKLIERFSAGGKRRVVMLGPTGFDKSKLDVLYPLVPTDDYEGAIKKLASDAKLLWVPARPNFEEYARARFALTRDSIHLTAVGQFKEAIEASIALVSFRPMAKASARPLRGDTDMGGLPNVEQSGQLDSSEHEPLRQLIIAKNRLWFDYWRPQNWAFLAGDRTAQPSSRDHLDPSKRWFPPEREAFLPLIEAKEKEIDALAAQHAGK